MEDCAICFDRKADCVNVPCGHQCACETCLNRLKTSNQFKCPICRARITSIVKAIRSGVQNEDEEREFPTTPTSNETKKIAIAKPRDLPDISLSVLPVDVTNKNTDAVVRISVSEPGEGFMCRLPVDICAVIDISGSMGADAVYEVDGQERTDGLRILDVAVHAIKVILSCLRKEDRFSLVAFDQTAELKFPLKNMTKKNQKDALKVANKLKQRGQTNIWGGIEKGMDSLRTSKRDSKFPDRNQVILLLTDGQPTTTPQGGHIHAFETYCRRNNFGCQMSCFGFGYSLDSKLMVEMSQVGSGTFAFIPMAPVLGTVFTHALASVLSTYTTNSKLVLYAPKSGGGSFVQQKMKGGLQVNSNRNDRMEIEVGPLLFGHTRDIVVPMRFQGQKDDQVVLEAKLVFGNGLSKELSAKGRQFGYNSNSEVAKIRALVSDTLLSCVRLGEDGKLQQAKKMLKKLEKLMEDSNEAYDERVVGLKKDVTGRCTKALDGRPRFNRWGKHYIRALLRAHSVQQCTNKLDIGVQVYGGVLFALMRQLGDEVFVALPPPTPPNPSCPMCGREFTRQTIEAHTNRCMGGGGGGYGGYGSSSSSSSSNQRKPAYVPPPRAPAVNINNYTGGGGGGGGGCFGGESTVVVVEGNTSKTIRVGDLKKGDVVKVSRGTAKVVCVVEYIRKDPKPLVSVPGGLFITSKHPMKVDGSWRMPEGLGKMVEAGGNGTVYNFVLEPRNSVLLVNGYECVALGHGLKGEIVEHAFYGSETSLNEVKKLQGYEDGKVSVDQIIRDEMGHAKGFL